MTTDMWENLRDQLNLLAIAMCATLQQSIASHCRATPLHSVPRQDTLWTQPKGVEGKDTLTLAQASEGLVWCKKCSTFQVDDCPESVSHSKLYSTQRQTE